MAMSRLFSSTNRYLTPLARPFSLRKKFLLNNEEKTHLATTHAACKYCNTTNHAKTDLNKYSEFKGKKTPSDAMKRPLRKLHNRIFSEEEIKIDKQLSETYDKSFNEHNRDRFGEYSFPSKTDTSSYASKRDSHKGSLETEQVSRRSLGRTRNRKVGSKESVINSMYGNIKSRNLDLRQNKLGREWSKTFGTLGVNISDSTTSGNNPADLHVTHSEESGRKSEEDEDEEDVPFRRLSERGRDHVPHWYGRQIENLGKQGKIKEAIAVLDDWMLKRDRVMPNTFVFTSLIGVVGRVGYTKKAFMLFNQMKKMGLQPVDHTYTALFNACSNSPWQQDGLYRATNLRQLMAEKGYSPNMITYKAMIKAFGMCGDLQTAFSVMDELASQHKLDSESFSFVLMACIADKESGFEHAIKVWMMMKKFQVSPDLHLFNLLLRVVRECGISDTDFMEKLSAKFEGGADALIQLSQDIRKIKPYVSLIPSEVSVQSSEPLNLTQQSSSSLKNDNTHNIGNNILPVTDSNQEHSSTSEIQPRAGHTSLLQDNFNKLLSFDDMKKPENRLAVIGGVDGFLDQMERRGVQPDIRTFSQLLDVLPSNIEAEDKLLSLMDIKCVKPDIDFFNMLIHKRCMRRGYEEARDVLKVIQRQDMYPNLHTFGCIAMTCTRLVDGRQLIKDMENMGLSPNLEIFTALVRTSAMNFMYKLVLLREIENLGIQPNERILSIIEKHIAEARHHIVLKEKNRPVNRFFTTIDFERGYKEFQKFYEPWLQRSSFCREDHPWQPFRKKLE